MLRKSKANKTWTTKTGEKISVKDLTNSHLVNIIKMLTRISVMPAYLKAITQQAKITSFFNHESMAAYYAEQDIDHELANPVLFVAPEYKYLFDEADKRNLVY